MNSNIGLLPRDFKLKTPERKKQSHLKLLDFRLRTLPLGLGLALVNLGLLISPAILSSPVQGAEQIYVSFGPLEISLPIAALEVYAKEGTIEPELATYTRYLNPEQLEQLKQVLVTRVEITPVAIAQFLYSPQGEIILQRIGQIIETKARQPGFYAIRAALIKAAAAPEGLTLLNVLREFPTYGIRINSNRGFEVLDDLSKLIQQTGGAIAAVEQQAITESTTQPSVNFSQLRDLRRPGSFSYSKQSLTLNDVLRNRSFPVDLYLPTSSSGLAPVIVISHGLGSDRQTFAYLAAHLASYGFAVAVPEHPGSNAQQVQALINGFVSEVAAPQELIDRPLDIKYLLDELKRSFGGRLNLQQVGVLGQSFGGYTALALVGAEINFEQLQQDCALENNSLNLSLLLQCRAEELLPTQYPLKDERVTAAIAINPIGSTIFGESQLSQIQVPLLLVAGSDDTVAPALPEQIQPFTWLTTPNKYLVLLGDGTHFSTLEASSGGVPVPSQVIGPAPEVAQNYMKALSVAFFQTYIAGQSDYQVYLSASYAQYISQSIIPVNLIQTLTPNQLTEVKAIEASERPSLSPP